jgi:hypothetical protein
MSRRSRTSATSLEYHEPLPGLVPDKASEEDVRDYINSIRAELWGGGGSALDEFGVANVRLWRLVMQTEPPRNLREAVQCQDKAERGSVDWYAAKLLLGTEVARGALKHHDWDYLCRAMFWMGHDFATLITLWANKKEIRLGAKQGKSLETARVRSAKTRKQQKGSRQAPWVARPSLISRSNWSPHSPGQLSLGRRIHRTCSQWRETGRPTSYPSN